MRPLLFIAVACACAATPGPKRPDESHRVPVNRTLPPEVEEAVKTTEVTGTQRQPRRGDEVEWR